MVIVESTVKNQFLPFNQGVFWGGIIIFAAISFPITILANYYNHPTGSYLSPLPQGQVASISPTISQPNKTFFESLNLAQNFLNKAYDLAKNSHQSETDKKDIVANLNESLRYATESINISPNKPEGYLIRAQILTAISKIKPEAINQAKADLDLAQKLSTNPHPTLPPVINPINLAPDERASLPQNIIIASPESTSSSKTNANASTNASKKTIVLPANQEELVVKDATVKESSYVYLIAKSGNNPVSVKSKASGTFTISIANPNPTDTEIEYWIIND